MSKKIFNIIPPVAVTILFVVLASNTIWKLWVEDAVLNYKSSLLQ